MKVVRKALRFKTRYTAASNRPSPSAPLPPLRLANQQDNRVILQLSTATIDSLDVDRAYRLTKPGEHLGADDVTELRLALIKVYTNAAKLRLATKATKEQFKLAQAAMAMMFEAAERLEEIKPAAHRGFLGIFGNSVDDSKGLDESSEFGAKCWEAKLKLTNVAMVLGDAINAEKKKSSAKGERKKRLRTLVDGLADWWISTTGKPIAPYVKAKRLDKGAFVLGRAGPFVELAVAIFCKIDDFKESEVISAVENTYKARLSSSGERQVNNV